MAYSVCLSDILFHCTMSYLIKDYLEEEKLYMVIIYTYVKEEKVRKIAVLSKSRVNIWRILHAY